ncbi:MAG: hypothetical protein CVU86_03560 [Firmicutes bacterium HGW-Firmicutes-11]|jgi:AcrR family transcriptional regulator|nr:MAG: hypothetical protein CVU86_03560 [Firmicutes bacterium HGW-Firmicutes-11]
MVMLKEAKQDKRDLILATALQLFIDRGYLETKVIDIAIAAGIAKGSVYAYFPSKEALFVELLKEYVVVPYAEFKDSSERTDATCSDKLRQFVQFEQKVALRFGNGKNFIDLLYAEKGLSRQPELESVMRQLMQLRFTLVYGIVDTGIRKDEFSGKDPHLLTLSLMGSIAMYISHQCGLLSHAAEYVPAGSRSGDMAEDVFFEFLFHGLRR